jgi:hypothetical protein
VTTIRIDVRSVSALADRLAKVDGRRLGVVALDVVNEVTTDFKEKAIRGAVKGINLTDAYVRSKTDLALATNPGRPRAEIVTKGDLTVLGNFAPLSRTVAPGAQRRAGPIAGFRSAGTQLAIKKGSYLSENQWFIMALRRGTEAGGNGFGVFVRSSKLKGKGKNDRGKGLGDQGRRRDGEYGKQHIYGPSPYSLFRKQIEVQGPQLQRDLESSAVRGLRAEIERVIL